VNWGGDDYANAKCAAVLTTGRHHEVRPSKLFRDDRSLAPWVECVHCHRLLWGLYMIHEEEDPISLL
jgi:hypothetical protein